MIINFGSIGWLWSIGSNWQKLRSPLHQQGTEIATAHRRGLRLFLAIQPVQDALSICPFIYWSINLFIWSKSQISIYLSINWSIICSYYHQHAESTIIESSKTIKEHFLALVPLHGMQSPKAQLRPWMKFWMKILNSWGCRDQGWSRLIKAEQGAEEKGLLLAQAGLAFRVYKAKHLSLKQGIDSHWLSRCRRKRKKKMTRGWKKPGCCQSAAL